jgi:hypothetical protein
VLDNIDGLSSLAAELLESRIDAATANKVRWGPRFALVATLSHFSELKSKLEFGRKADLTEDQTDALWPWWMWPQTRWRRSFLPRLPVTHLTAQGSSSGSLYC